MASYSYVVKTDLPPDQLTLLAVSVFVQWVEFALGQRSLGNKQLVYPTGRYAASIEFRQESETSIAIVASAPEADIIEQGHGSVDLKTKLQPGRAYPMHRPVGAVPGVRLRRIGSGPPSLKPRLWAELQRQSSSGFASIGPNSAADSWIIPAMPAYSPAMILAAQAQAEARKTR